MIRRHFLLAALVGFVALGIQLPSLAKTPPPGPFKGKVVKVADGDTLTVLVDQEERKIRLRGIDCPEKKQPFGKKAKDRSIELAANKEVEIKPETQDRYGRLVAEVLLQDGSSLNKKLVEEGLAWWYREYAPKDKELERLENEARTTKRGLWSEKAPVEPWVFRKKDHIR